MKHTLDWNQALLLNSPLFMPLQPVVAQLNCVSFPGLQEWNTLLSSKYGDITVKNGLPLKFVPQEPGKSGFESQYEPRCYTKGEVQTRVNNWHDCFNALVWLTYPKSKAAINARHFQALNNQSKQIDNGSSQRGKVRDMATLFDESGVVIACAEAEFANLVRTFQWKELFWTRRRQLSRVMEIHIFGHGLYEKALQPYTGMTGQGMLIRVEREFFDWPLQNKLANLDQRIADYLENPELCRSTRELHPIPLLGMPGLSTENVNEAYYENTSYFRPGRSFSNN